MKNFLLVSVLMLVVSVPIVQAHSSSNAVFDTNFAMGSGSDSEGMTSTNTSYIIGQHAIGYRGSGGAFNLYIGIEYIGGMLKYIPPGVVLFMLIIDSYGMEWVTLNATDA